MVCGIIEVDKELYEKSLLSYKGSDRSVRVNAKKKAKLLYDFLIFQKRSVRCKSRY